MNTRCRRSTPIRPVFWPWMAALALIILPGLVRAGDDSPLPLELTLLTRDLGDPRDPGNAKLVVAMPDTFQERLPSLRPEDFSVYIHPADVDRADGLDDAYRADGLYLWRDGPNVFLDVRVVPLQHRDGPAVVRVVYAPDGEILGEGMAEGFSRYGADLADVALVVDISLSMTINDPDMLRVQAARSFIEMARRGGGIGRVGLVTFNHNARRDLPLLPLERGEELLDALGRIGAEGLTNLDLALDMGMQVLEGSSNPVIVFLTDGKNEGTDYADTHLRAARDGIRLYTVGLSPQADHDLLKEMAAVSGGLYFQALHDSDLPDIYARLAAELGKRRLLHSRLLDEPEGEVAVPIDATVERMLIMAEGEARVAALGPDDADGVMTSAQVVLPAPGLWTVRWDRAEPERTTLTVFGDTPFFLDMFPPQLRGRRLTLAATLAEGRRPLPGADIWLQPVPGLFSRPVRLHDDGRHGDGMAGDGVYGAIVDMDDDAPDGLILSLLASGVAWDAGGFVRQARETAVRQPDLPPDYHARLDGDVDFGVLFPGETGSALAVLDLDSRIPRDVDLDLHWEDDGAWPRLSSGVTVQPGRRTLELEITVPDGAAPGDYHGLLTLGGDGLPPDSVPARVRVGTVTFDEHPGVDFGSIPPGTFAEQSIRIGYHADRDVALEVEADGTDLAVSAPDRLPAGRGDVVLEAAVSPPIGREEGDYYGSVTLRAGPGRGGTGLGWQVRPYSTAAPESEPLADLPELPELPAEAAPLRRVGDGLDAGESAILIPPERGGPAEPMHGEGPTPWEKTSRTLRERPEYPAGAAGPIPATGKGMEERFDIPVARAAARDSLWNAWWVYLLAALLLLLLLLLLVAYILYRLGKSHLARLLLASALVNIVLLAVFILLLSTADVTVDRPPVIAVNLVADEPEERIQLSATEQATMEASLSSRESSSAGNSSPDPVEAALADADGSSAHTGMELEKPVEMEDGLPMEVELADAPSPAAQPLEDQRREPLQRRDRRMERSRDEAQPYNELAMAEMAEPPAETDRAMVGQRRVDEARAEAADTPDASPGASWSEAVRPVQEPRERRERLASLSPGMEAVRLEPATRRADPRGRRRSLEDLPEIEPEQRVEIADPLRDMAVLEVANAAVQPEGEPGVEEIRIEPRHAGDASLAGGKPGLIGESEVVEHLLAASGTTMESAPPPGTGDTGRMRPGRRGAPSRDGRSAGPQGGMPGGQGESATPASSSSSPSGRSGVAQPGEQRFDAGGGSPDASLAATGGPSRADSRDGPGGSSPSALPGTGDRGERIGFTPGRPGSARNDGPRSHPGTGQTRQRGIDGPQGPGEIPGGSGLAASPAGDGARPGTGRGRGPVAGAGEGRMDDMTRGGGGSGLAFRPGTAGNGPGGSRLDDDGPAGAGAAVPLDRVEADWKRGQRRVRPREFNVAASSVEMDSLLLVLGDFGVQSDPATDRLFSVLSGMVGRGMRVEQRLLSPRDVNLGDSLLALVSPEAAAAWSESDYHLAARYLEEGGHIWMDAPDSARAAPFLGRLTGLTGGSVESFPAGHALSGDEPMDALVMNGAERPAVVVTYQNWRPRWRAGDGGDSRALRFLVRSLNLFLSGDAETGITLEPGAVDGMVVQPPAQRMPESLAGGAPGAGTVWEDFSAGTPAGWRMPSWSDPGEVSVIPDGEGGRAMRVDLGRPEKGRAAVYRTLTPPEDLSRIGEMTLDAYYDGMGEASLSMIFTVRGGDGWMDYETPATPLRPGWNRLAFEIDRNNFRSLAEGGVIVHAMPGREQTGRAGFFLYREDDSPAVLLLRDLRIHGD